MPIVSPPPNKPRIAPLSVLPVFFDLMGKRVIIIGGSDAAAWKAELLMACNAKVEVFAEELDEEFRALLANHGAPNSIVPSPLNPHPTAIAHIPRHWTATDLTNAAFAIADIEDDAEALAFTKAARAAGVPYNIIDRPRFCQFQFGSIVNRSPIVVGISTNGAAPILGQAVRRRIETLLPQTLSGWAQLAQNIRAKVMASLEPGPQRRAFWERFAERAFTMRSEPVHLDGEIAAIAAAPIAGRVTLVSAGPGDADLLTIKAVRALQSAEIILFDDSVSTEILELARREAKRVFVGKRAVQRTGDLLLTLAGQGKHVVHLGSGLVSVDIDALERQGIPVTIVPGVASQPFVNTANRAALRRVPLRAAARHDPGGNDEMLGLRAAANALNHQSR